MKVLWILAVLVLSVSAFPIEEDDRVNGENGWFVPQLDGSFEWVDMEEAEAKMEQLALIRSRDLLDPLVDFYLYTAANPNLPQSIEINSNSISNSNFNAANPTRFVIHGWTSGLLDPMNSGIREAWLSHHDCNIIFVDWEEAHLTYSLAVLSVPDVGKEVAEMINLLVSNHSMPLDSVHVIGHSLGAHVAGFAGKNTNGVLDTIVGLDPALPLYKYNTPDKRLASTDARYVQSIQTDGGGLGFLDPIGQGAFYPNGGKRQPGCALDITGVCSHIRAPTYYAEAVKHNNYLTYQCADYLDAINNACGNSYSNVRMGAVDDANKVAGYFNVPVNNDSPYGKDQI